MKYITDKHVMKDSQSPMNKYITDFWNTIPYCLVGIYQHFGETFFLYS
jgi:hypothetical protein